MSGYCPQWVYSTCIGLIIKDFIEKDIPLDLLSRKYGKELSESMMRLTNPNGGNIEDIVRILAEISDKAVNYIRGLCISLLILKVLGKPDQRNFSW